MTTDELEAATDRGAPHHYVRCDYCNTRESTEWSVIAGPNGEIRQIECKGCGGTGWERGQEANHV